MDVLEQARCNDAVLRGCREAKRLWVYLWLRTIARMLLYPPIALLHAFYHFINEGFL